MTNRLAASWSWNNSHAFLVVLNQGFRLTGVCVPEKVVVRCMQKLYSTSINKHLDFACLDK